ncbi:unnamed protein product [Durusdinium trenchii]|uniref:Uncharacterized protein n=1 Tax=Durusdinium trenchii TaxID=1381693 RepID=A0ABP0SQV1_9DINO
MAGSNRSYVGSTRVGTNQMLIPADTEIPDIAYLLVFARSLLQEQTTPVGTLVFDRSSSVSQVSFTDYDLDSGEIGGNVSWIEPSDLEEVQAYRVYLAEERSLVTQVATGSTEALLPTETPLGDFTQLLVYTKSLLAEQTTPASVDLSDTSFYVVQESFTDLDLDASDLGGPLSWLEARDDQQVTHYTIYLGYDCSENITIVATEDVLLAVMSGRMDMSFGGSATQLTAAVRNALAQQLQVDVASIYVTVQVAVGRRLATNWIVEYLVVVSDLQVAGVVDAVEGMRADVASFRNLVVGELVQAGVSNDLVLGMAISSITTVAVQYVTNEQLPALLPDTSNVTEVRRLSSGNFSEAMYFINILNGTRYRFVSCGSRRYIGEVPVRTTRYDVPVETRFESNATHILIYASSEYAESSIASGFVRVEDAEASVLNLTFTDEDLDANELGGTVNWVLPLEGLGVSRVQNFSVYLTTDTFTERSALGSGLSNSSLAVLADTPKQNYQRLAVYTVSSLVEQTTPSSLLLFDTDSSVSSLDFPDFDLDGLEVGGILSWIEPEQNSQVISYVIYWASDIVNQSGTWLCIATNSSADDSDSPGLLGPCRGQLYAEVPVGTSNLTVPAETHRGTYTHFFVYARSSFVEQSSPAILEIFDLNASVSNLQFDGKDLDLYELGGVLSWDPPEELLRVHVYVAYLAIGDRGQNRSQIGSDVPVGTDQLDIPPEPPRLSFSHFVLYTKSTLVEQSTPTSLLIQDAVASSSNVTFKDKDLDQWQVAGNITWVEADDTSDVEEYLIYMAEDRFGSNRSLLGSANPGSTSFAVEDNTPLLSFTHFVVYSRSSLVEQSTPGAVVIIDVSAAVEQLSFVDLDLDASELGGEVTWSPPTSGLEQVNGYGVYLSDAAYVARSQIGIVPKGTHVKAVPDSTARQSFTHVLVYSRSDAFQQSTPAATAISDALAQVTSLEFTDFDLDETEVGGTLMWQAPEDTTYVAYYNAYKAYFCNDTNDTNGEPIYVAGTFSFLMEASPEQVSSAARSALASVLGVAPETLSVTINLARRLSSSSFQTNFIVHYELPVMSPEVPHLLAGSAEAEADGMVAVGFAQLLSKELCQSGLPAQDLSLQPVEGLHLEVELEQPTVMEEDSSTSRMRSWLLTEEALARRLTGAVDTDDSDADTNQSDTTDEWDLSNFTGDVAAQISGLFRFNLAGANAGQVRLAAKNALAATFGVSVNDISNLHLIDTEDFC